MQTRRFCLLTCLIILVSGLKISEVPRKQLSGPPSEFKNFKLPTPLDAAVGEESISLEIKLQPNSLKSTTGEWKTDLLVDSTEEFRLSLLSPVSLNIQLIDPNGKQIDVSENYVKGEFPIGLHHAPEITYIVSNPKAGIWKLLLTKSNFFDGQSQTSSSFASTQGIVILWNKSPVKAFSHLSSYSLKLNDDIGLITSTTEETLIQGVRPTALRDTIADAMMEVILPDGNEIDVQMHDDGLHNDLEASDGIYGALLKANETGIYRATAFVKGVDKLGNSFFRSTQHVIPVVDDFISFIPQTPATTKTIDSERIKIFIPVSIGDFNNFSEKLYRGYAQVWAKDENNNEAPVCWISSIVDVKEENGKKGVELELNLKWVALAKLNLPLTLKEVVLQETNSFIPVAETSEIQVESNSRLALNIVNLRNVKEISKEMKFGKSLLQRTNATENRKVILTHGYCSGENPWSKQKELFTDAAFFLKANANMNNQQFAESILQFAEKEGITSFGLIAHSQGGTASAHLLNYFESGLDFAEGERRIQTLGTPWKGCSAAGSAAGIGKIFGIGCGANADLSTDGAILWLAGISPEVRKEIYSYTTTYELGNFFGDYCNLAINALLKWPNDGTAELDLAKLPNGNYMGNTEKQCHTTDMAYDAQYEDTARNILFNQKAAR